MIVVLWEKKKEKKGVLIHFSCLWNIKLGVFLSSIQW